VTWYLPGPHRTCNRKESHRKYQQEKCGHDRCRNDRFAHQGPIAFKIPEFFTQPFDIRGDDVLALSAVTVTPVLSSCSLSFCTRFSPSCTAGLDMAISMVACASHPAAVGSRLASHTTCAPSSLVCSSSVAALVMGLIMFGSDASKTAEAVPEYAARSSRRIMPALMRSGCLFL
jgi:hypothetical protein